MAGLAIKYNNLKLRKGERAVLWVSPFLNKGIVL